MAVTPSATFPASVILSLLLLSQHESDNEAPRLPVTHQRPEQADGAGGEVRPRCRLQ